MRKKEASFKTKFFSEIGTKLENNDFFGYIYLDNYAIWVVADGFDEENGAFLAAKIAVESVIEYFLINPQFNKEIINKMFNYANEKIKEKQLENEKKSYMHTSLLIIISDYSSILYGNVGNTRFYHMKGNKIVENSLDDTISQILVEKGIIGKEQLKEHRQRNELLQAVGDMCKIEPNIIKEAIKLEEGDSLIFVTRGIWENLGDNELEKIIKQGDSKNREKILKIIENKIMRSNKKEIENHTLVLVDIDKVAPYVEIEKNYKDKIVKIGVGILAVSFILGTLNILEFNKQNKMFKKIENFKKISNEELIKKNFNNSKENLELAKIEGEYISKDKKGLIKIINIITSLKKFSQKSEKEMVEIDKIKKEIEKIENIFMKINDANILFDNGNYDEAIKEYEESKYMLGEIEYKKDEININEVVTILESRIEMTEQLKSGKNLEMIGDVAIKYGNYKEAKEKYDEAYKIYTLNGRMDYIPILEKKILEMEEKQKTMFTEATVSENRGNSYFGENIELSKKAYEVAIEMYKVLGNKEKIEEITNKIKDIENQKIIYSKEANEKVEEGLKLITINKYVEGITKLIEGKDIYKKIGDENNIATIDSFMNKAENYMELEKKYDETIKIKEEENKLKILAKEEEIRREKEKMEEIAKTLEKIVKLEEEGENLFLLKRYSESIKKYEEIEKVYLEMKNKYNFKDEKFYDEIRIRVERKISECNKKLNKKWWEIWK